MTKEEIVISMLLLRKSPDYSYIVVEKDDDNVSYTVHEPCLAANEEGKKC